MSDGNLSPWQQHEREYLLALIQNNHITKQTNFEQRLAQDNMRIANVAAHYQIRVEDITNFLRMEYQRLLEQNRVSAGQDNVRPTEIAEWQASELQHIEKLIQEHTWSLEELERELRKDQKRLQLLADQYHVTVDEIEQWYRFELGKLLTKQILQSENLSEWQKREKDRLFTTVTHQNLSINELERQLQTDRHYLKRLAAQYRITPEQLINWQKNELQRLKNLGYGKTIESASLKNWQFIESKRLRIIPEKIIITREELIAFIESDKLFQNNLTANYEVSNHELLEFQNQELHAMENEGLIEILRLKHLENWQRLERDRIYGLIRHQTFSSKKLQEWQTDDKTTRIAASYGVPAYILRNWQKQEIERIENIAKHYKMSLNALEDFRFRELQRLQMVAHKDYVSKLDYNTWSARENVRLQSLIGRTGLSGDQLNKWRRKLFLLAQGLIDLNFNEGGYGGIEISSSATSSTAKHNETISSDRGDQPPQVYQDNEESEPKLGYPPNIIPAKLSESYPSHLLPTIHAPVTVYPQIIGNQYSQTIHKKKEYTFTGPVVQDDSDYQNRYSQGRGTSTYANMRSYPMTKYSNNDNADSDLGKQIQVENWNPYSDDPDQQTEKLEGYSQNDYQVPSGHMTYEDLGQQWQQPDSEDIGGQQVQQEIYQQEDIEKIPHNANQTLSLNSHQAFLNTASTEKNVVAAEPITQKPKSWFGKAKDWFG